MLTRSSLCKLEPSYYNYRYIGLYNCTQSVNLITNHQVIIADLIFNAI